MTRYKKPFLIYLLFFLTAFFYNNECFANNKKYLQELPTVKQIMTDIQGSDELDTAVRQRAALLYLMSIYMGIDFQMSPKKNTKYKAYIDARKSIERQYTVMIASDNLAVDKTFRNELVKRYFSPQFQQYLKEEEERPAKLEKAREEARQEQERKIARRNEPKGLNVITLCLSIGGFLVVTFLHNRFFYKSFHPYDADAIVVTSDGHGHKTGEVDQRGYLAGLCAFLALIYAASIFFGDFLIIESSIDKIFQLLSIPLVAVATYFGFPLFFKILSISIIGAVLYFSYLYVIG